MSAPPKTHGRSVWELNKSCRQKRRFSDEMTARAAAQIECDRGGAVKRGAMWVYGCETCRGWHITNKPSGSKRRVTREHLYPPTDRHLDDGICTPQFGGFWAEDNDLSDGAHDAPRKVGT